MAVIGNDDFRSIRNWVRSNSTYRSLFRNSGLTIAVLKSTLQAIEDYSVGSYTTTPTESLKSAIDTAAGTTMTTGQAQGLWYAWANWKANI